MWTVLAATHMMYGLVTQAIDKLSRAHSVNLAFFQLNDGE